MCKERGTAEGGGEIANAIVPYEETQTMDFRTKEIPKNEIQHLKMYKPKKMEDEKIMKKLSLFLAAAIAASMLTAVPASAMTGDDAPLKTQYTLGDTLDFENFTVDSSYKGGIKVEDRDTTGKALNLYQVGSGNSRVRANYLVDWPETISTGVLTVEFDLKFTAHAYGASDCLGNESTVDAKTTVLRFDNNSMAVYTKDNGRVIASDKLTSGAWNAVKFKFDFENDQITGYVNNTACDTAAFPTGFDSMGGFMFFKGGSDCNWSIDNFKADWEKPVDQDMYEMDYTIGETLTFDDTAISGSDVASVVTDSERKVLKLDKVEGRNDAKLKLNFSPVNTGKYELKFDFKGEGLSGWSNKLTPNGVTNSFLEIAGDSKYWQAQGIGQLFGTTATWEQWHTYKLIIDLDTQIVRGYLDGNKLLSAVVTADGSTNGKALVPDSISSWVFSLSNKAGYFYIDNFKFAPVVSVTNLSASTKDTNTATVTMDVANADSVEYTLICVGTDAEGRVKSIGTQKVALDADGNKTQEVQMTTTGCDEYKVFLWSDLDTMVPIV